MRIKNARGIDIAVIAATLASYLVVFLLWHWSWADAFWDFDVYRRAVTDLVLGYNAYRPNEPLPFLYHPVVLHALVPLDRFLGLENAFIGLYMAALLIFLWGSGKIRQDQLSRDSGWHDKAFMAAAAFSFGGLGVLSVMTGNITFYMHLALIGSVLIYLHNRKGWQWLLVLTLFFCALLVKPYFLLYALPLFLIGRSTSRSILLLSISILFAVWVYLLFWIFDKAHSMQFVQALRTQLASKGDLSISFFGLAKHVLPVDQAMKIHLALAAILGLAVLFLRRLTARIAAPGGNDAALFLLAYAAMTLCNPRMKEYDLIPALLCLYFYLSLHGLLGRSMILLSLCIGQIPLWAEVYWGGEAMPAIFVELGPWQTLGAVVPALLFFAASTYLASSRKPAPAAVA